MVSPSVASVDRGAAQPVRAGGAQAATFPAAQRSHSDAANQCSLAYSLGRAGCAASSLPGEIGCRQAGATSMTACPLHSSRLVTLHFTTWFVRKICLDTGRGRAECRGAVRLHASRPSPNTRIHRDVPRRAVPGNGRLWGFSRTGLSWTAAARFSEKCHSHRLTPPSLGLSALGAGLPLGMSVAPRCWMLVAGRRRRLAEFGGWLSGRCFRRSRLRKTS